MNLLYIVFKHYLSYSYSFPPTQLPCHPHIPPHYIFPGYAVTRVLILVILP